MNSRMTAYSALGLVSLALVATQASAPAQTPGGSFAAVTTTPEFKATPVEVGDALMMHQRYQAAIEAYKKAPSNSPDAWNKMGLAYQLMFNINEATRCYEKAMKLSPQQANFVNNMGSIYMERREYGHAVRNFKKAVKLDPQSALFEKNLGTALLAQRKYNDGWKAYQRALALDSQIFDRNRAGVHVDNPASLLDRGAMNFYMARGCVKAGMLTKAIDYLRMAMNEGFTDTRRVLADPEFAVLFDVPGFQEMIASQNGYAQAASTHTRLLH